MAKPLLPDALWEQVQPLLPPEPPKPKGGRPRVADRACLTGILFVLKSGCPWEYLPQEMGCGSGMTCWRRLRDWHEVGVWLKIWTLCSTLWAKPTPSIGRQACSTVARCAPFLGGENRSESNGSRQSRFEAASDHRPERHAPGHRPHGGQRPRFP